MCDQSTHAAVTVMSLVFAPKFVRGLGWGGGSTNFFREWSEIVSFLLFICELSESPLTTSIFDGSNVSKMFGYIVVNCHAPHAF